MRLVLPEFSWNEINPAISDHVDQICRSWEGTPYMRGQMCKGVGVDCVRFVCAVLSELYGWPLERPDCLPPDASMHDPRGMRKSVRTIMRKYDLEGCRVLDGSLEPGDALMTGPRGGGPGHAMFAGALYGEIWHVERRGRRVCRTGLALFEEEQAVFEVYRPKNKDQWTA